MTRVDAEQPQQRTRRAKWIVPASAACCYLLFTVAVHLRMLDTLDLAFRHAFHVGEVWGIGQTRAARVVNDLAPNRLALALVICTAILSLARRTARPIVVVAVVGAATVMVTEATKWIMAHSDPGAPPVAHGSFPSGHEVTVIVVFGLLVLLFRPDTRWGWIFPGFMAVVAGSVLILAWVHPVTDVLGGALLAIAALTCAPAAGLGQWASGKRPRSVG